MSEDFLVQSGASLTRLANLAKVIDAGGVSAAAQIDGPNASNQSLYSKQMAELEKAFGKRLFTKDGRGRKPTLVAKQLAATYSAFSSSVEALIRDSQGRNSVVRIGAGDSVYKWLLLPEISKLEGSFKSVSFELRNLRTKDVIAQVQSGEVDIGIAELRELPSGIEAMDLRRMEFGLYYHLDTFGKCEIEQVLRKDRLLGLGNAGTYVRNCHDMQKRFGLPQRFWLTFDSLPMVADSMVQAKATAFLPLEMESDLKKAGFVCIHSKDIDNLSRSYSLLLSKYSSRIKARVRDVAGKLVNLVQ